MSNRVPGGPQPIHCSTGQAKSTSLSTTEEVRALRLDHRGPRGTRSPQEVAREATDPHDANTGGAHVIINCCHDSSR
jgi:hypothetical protein